MSLIGQWPSGPGSVVVLNGVPRSGKSSIAGAIQREFEGVWVNLGVDRMMPCLPEKARPGIGLRPGGERPDLEPLVARLYRALYDSVAAHARQGLNVVVDVGHHESYRTPVGSLADAARRLAHLPAILVGVRCPMDEIITRRDATGMPAPREILERWQTEVHLPGIYDLEVDTSILSPSECAAAIAKVLAAPPSRTAFERLAASS